jgi:hypothetical protein
MHEHGHNVEIDGEIKFMPPKSAFNNSEPMEILDEIEEFVKSIGCETLFDYGAGKGESFRTPEVLRKLGLATMSCWDPAVSGIQEFPFGIKQDCVLCTDVLEHIPVQDIPWVLDEIFSIANKAVYLTITTSPSYALMPDGTNAHCSAMTPEWWSTTVSAALKRSNKPIKLCVKTYYGRH